MKLKDKSLLIAHMQHRDYTQARLARAAGCSRQFIHLLVKGDKNTCSETKGERIEEALDVPRGTLFLREKSPVKRARIPRQADAA